MKKSDLTTILIIASISVIAAFFIAKSIFGDTYTGQTKVRTIDKIDSSIIQPSTDIFNKNAINPTVQVYVTGTNTNTNITTPGA